MVNKLLSCTTLACMTGILLLVYTGPSGPISSFVSLDETANALRLILVGSMMALAFKEYIKRCFIRRLTAAGGMVLVAFGISALIVPALTAAVFDYLKFLDLLLIAEAGIVFSSVGLDKSFAKQIEPEHREVSVKIPVKVTGQPA